MAGEFGALTDHFGILALTHGAGTLADILKLVESNKTPIPKDRADAKDEYGDIVASTYYGNAAGTIYEATCKYQIVAGSLDLDELMIGELATGIVAEVLEANTENGDWPLLSITGKLGMAAIQVPAGKTAKCTLPSDITILGARMAQTMLFATGNGCRLTKSTFKASGSIGQTEDGVGEPAAYGISFETAEITAEFVRVTTAPSWTVAHPAVEKQAPSLNEPKAAYHTGTGIAEIPLARDAA